MTLSCELRVLLHDYVRDRRSLADVFDWLTDHVQEVADAEAADPALQRLEALAWGAVIEWQESDTDEATIRRDLAAQLGVNDVMWRLPSPQRTSSRQELRELPHGPSGRHGLLLQGTSTRSRQTLAPAARAVNRPLYTPVKHSQLCIV